MSEPRLPDLTRSFERLLRPSWSASRVDDLDFEHDVARGIGKARRERSLPFGRKRAVALDRYLRVRSRHTHAAGGVK